MKMRHRIDVPSHEEISRESLIRQVREQLTVEFLSRAPITFEEADSEGYKGVIGSVIVMSPEEYEELIRHKEIK